MTPTFRKTKLNKLTAIDETTDIQTRKVNNRFSVFFFYYYKFEFWAKRPFSTTLQKKTYFARKNNDFESHLNSPRNRSSLFSRHFFFTFWSEREIEKLHDKKWCNIKIYDRHKFRSTLQ